jgi:endonuclease/exonuclease/phosphatase family metal-dependent hydrolase
MKIMIVKLSQYKIGGYGHFMFIKKTFFLFCFVQILFIATFPSAAAEKKITVMSFNLWNYFVIDGKYSPIKREKSKAALVEVIKTTDPDIIMISEIGGEPALNDFLAHLKKAGLNYSFGTVMYGADRTRHIGCIAKFAPIFVRKNYDLTYNIKPKSGKELEKVYVQRGFLHVLFDIDGYKLNIINAHFKSRLPNPRYNQTDMRRLEARLLKYYVNALIKKFPKANVLVTGDLNDVYSSNPLVTLRGVNQKQPKRLYDLKPVDSGGASWTHWWKKEDSYGRIDYLLASSSLLPEIDFEKTEIYHNPDFWLYASDHRPVMTVINTKDKKAWDKTKIDKKFKDGIRK